MPDFDLTFQRWTHTLDEHFALSGVLFFPEVIAFDATDGSWEREALRQVRHYLNEMAPVHWFRRRGPGDPPTVGEVQLTFDPPPNDVRWLDPVTLTFHYISWSPSKSLFLAFVPVLGIEAFATTEEELLPEVEKQIRFSLKRQKLTQSLGSLIEFGRRSKFELKAVTASIEIPSPKQIMQREGEPAEKSILREIATKLRPKKLPPAFEVQSVVDRLKDALTGEKPRSVLLVGPSGVGKTAVVHELVRTRAVPLPFWASSGSRLVAGASGYGMWQDRCQKLIRESERNPFVLHLGNAIELLEAGKGGGSGQGIADFLAPRIAEGKLRVVLECTAEQREILERNAISFLNAFEEVTLDEPDGPTGRSILMSYGLWKADEENDPLTVEAVEKLDRLHRRYATYSVYPGRPLRFLRNLLDDRTPGVTLNAEDVTLAFSVETGMPLELLDEQTPLDLQALQERFRSRVIGQTNAVDSIVNLMAAVKSGMTQPDRPIASLLFIGPTGVGKTEMSKAITEYFYGDKRRMIRIDMSEYADPLAADRLIGGRFGREGVLTSQVRDQPFGVVLFDEFEKAHPVCFDLLLQILGEGRLTDASGQLADFRNTVIVMTSNLGVESSQRGSVGFVDPLNTEENMTSHFIAEVQKFLRPEMFNRIDRIIPFQPLGDDILLRIANRELDLVMKRDGLLYRGVSLDMAEGTVEWLVRQGTDPRYGARPLKRAIERELLRPLADGCNRYLESTPLAAQVTLTTPEMNGLDSEHDDEENGEAAPEASLSVLVKPIEGEAWKESSRFGARRDSVLINITNAVAWVRRQNYRVNQSALNIEARNEQFRLNRERLKKQARKKSLKPEDAMRLAFLNDYLHRFDRFFRKTNELENELCFELYRGESSPTGGRQRQVIELRNEHRSVMLTAYASTLSDYDRQRIAVLMIGQESDFLNALKEGYERYGEQHDLKTRTYLLAPYSAVRHWKQDALQSCTVMGAPSRKDLAQQNNVSDYQQLAIGDVTAPEPPPTESKQAIVAIPEGHASGFSPFHEGFCGFAISCQGFLAAERLEAEGGVHVYRGDVETKILVDTCKQLKHYVPPDDLLRKSKLNDTPVQRIWHAGRRHVRSPERFLARWTNETIPELLDTILDDELWRRVYDAL